MVTSTALTAPTPTAVSHGTAPPFAGPARSFSPWWAAGVRNAFGFFSHGAKMVPLPDQGATTPGGRGKLDPAGLETVLRRDVLAAEGDYASVPSALSLTNVTEEGTVYTAAETAALAAIAHNNGLVVHLDGARFANAVCSERHGEGQRPTAAELTWKAGVDVMSFGCTKNGGMNADLVIFFRQELIGDLRFRLKRSGHLPSKMRFLSAQVNALLLSDVWLRNGANANAMATYLHSGLARLAAITSSRHVAPEPPDANEVFVEMEAATAEAMRERGHGFQASPVDGREGMVRVRFVPAWCTEQAECDALLASLEECLSLPAAADRPRL